jgi:hypothetical protein
MNRAAVAILLCTWGFSPLNLLGQEKIKTEEKTEAKHEITPVRVQVVISEYDGDKKVSSLPYTLLLNAEPRGGTSSIRMGVRVPIATGNAGMNVNYESLGTDIDGWASPQEDGRFALHLNVQRSSAYRSPTAQKSAEVGGSEVIGTQPVIQQFKTQLQLLMRDGQTIQSTLATDPVSGRVSKVDVTLNILK